jgi:hypothetical protein
MYQRLYDPILGGSRCPHSMARLWVADGWDGQQQWRVAAKVLNKQPRTNDNGRSSSLGLGIGLITPHRNKEACYETINRASGSIKCWETIEWLHNLCGTRLHRVSSIIWSVTKTLPR